MRLDRGGEAKEDDEAETEVDEVTETERWVASGDVDGLRPGPMSSAHAAVCWSAAAGHDEDGREERLPA